MVANARGVQLTSAGQDDIRMAASMSPRGQTLFPNDPCQGRISTMHARHQGTRTMCCCPVIDALSWGPHFCMKAGSSSGSL